MRIKEICTLVAGKVVCGADRLEVNVDRAFASDLMSDVLTLKNAGFLLLTGLANVQSVRIAEMSDAACLLLCRGKQASPEMVQLAREDGLVIVQSEYSMYKCAGLLFQAGLLPVY
ncbi:MAG: hypothetical protein LUD68_00955 [Rikenellaceae bacterium]|nr:hypothetical protein [Rikenellaceae bacterium]